jgi:hypothetical protein
MGTGGRDPHLEPTVHANQDGTGGKIGASPTRVHQASSSRLRGEERHCDPGGDAMRVPTA